MHFWGVDFALIFQYDPETSPRNVHYHGPPQVMFAYLKYLWSLGEDHRRRDAFARLQVSFSMITIKKWTITSLLLLQKTDHNSPDCN